jgi:NADP-dependent 3-hydroxy acid dehydrogenase YdfG
MTQVLESQPLPANPPSTGGTRGIGAAIAYSLANQGATVAVGYNRDQDSAERFVAALSKKTRPHGASASAHRGNVGSCEDCRRTIAEVIETHGRLDILVNNAGITIDKTVAAMTEDDWHGVLAVNLSGAFFLSQAALAHMLERGTGRIVNVSSVVGETGNIGQANYAASKSGLFGLTKTLAKETAYQLARSGDRHHRQHGDPRPDHHRDDRRYPREGDGEADRPDTRRPRRKPRGGRAGRSFPRRRRVLLYHGPDLERQRWHGHVIELTWPCWFAPFRASNPSKR